MGEREREREVGGGRQLRWWRGGRAVVLQLQSYPSPHLVISYAYIDPSLTTTQPLPSLSPSLDIKHRPHHQADRGSVWPERVPSQQNSCPRRLSGCWRWAVHWPRRGKLARSTTPSRSIMFFLFTITLTLSFPDQTCWYCWKLLPTFGPLFPSNSTKTWDKQLQQMQKYRNQVLERWRNTWECFWQKI